MLDNCIVVFCTINLMLLPDKNGSEIFLFVFSTRDVSFALDPNSSSADYSFSKVREIGAITFLTILYARLERFKALGKINFVVL